MSSPSTPEAYAVAEPVSPSEQQQQQQLVQIVAPSTLEAGYTFLANVDGRTISVTVPEGGVKDGQTFTVPMNRTTPTAPMASAEHTPLTAATTASYGDVTPRGMWKDGLCKCCCFGPCHPHLWNAICCPQILMAQVLTRMHMSWLGQRDSPDYTNTFKKVLILFISYLVLTRFVLAPPQPELIVTGDDMDYDVQMIQPHVPFLQIFFYHLINVSFALYSLIVLIKLRRAVRDRYRIPSQSPCGEDVEDCCASFWCGCCTVAQLARHTADYQERRAMFCSSTGLPSPPPTVIVV